MSAPAPGRVDVLGCPVDPLDMGATVSRCLELAEADGPCASQVSINAAKVVEAQRNTRMANFIGRCELASADGQAVVWAARLLGTPLPERVAGIDLMHALIAEAAVRGLSVFFLGAREEVLQTAVARIRESHPALEIAGTRDGYFPDDREDEVVAEIAAARPAILFIAISSPHKEEFIDRNRDRLGARFAMGVGGALDVVAGRARRAPVWMQSWGLEWLYRLAQEPTRMFRRYAVGNGRFAWLLVKELVHRRRNAGSRG